MTHHIKILMNMYQTKFDTYLATLDEIETTYPNTMGRKRVINRLNDLSIELRKIDTQITQQINLLNYTSYEQK